MLKRFLCVTAMTIIAGAATVQATEWLIDDDSLFNKCIAEQNFEECKAKNIVLKEKSGIFYNPVTNKPYTGGARDCYECEACRANFKDGKLQESSVFCPE
ncbi:MAG: hypothetical protein FWF51_09665 [Chitinivibrionia bacterium]|nr:hypothetical protein [Chitinivibrionia bacterium]